ncbi:MAG: glycosyltransferase [Treponema sp.]|nr:glycosyltransferase [Spirochaetia bacterium]MDY2838865.1 glycosyltransferase [Treponema sp.]
MNALDKKKYTIYLHPQITENEYKEVMPLSNKSIFVKIYYEIKIYFRMRKALKADIKNGVDTVIISRRILNRIFPNSFKKCLVKMKQKDNTKIIWDFDDQILITKEISKSGFDFLSRISDYIIVTQENLKSLISNEFINKVLLLPTTDGDIYQEIDSNVVESRKYTLSKVINLIWIGTQGNLKFLEPVIPVLDQISEKLNKKIKMIIVSDGKVEQNTKYIEISNIKWSRRDAIEQLKIAHIGLMPLIDTEFTRGKAGFKLVQYLSASLPIIGSNVGFNKKICDSSVGKLVNNFSDINELLEAINFCTSSEASWYQLSINARKKWLDNFDYQNNLRILETIINM